MKLRNTLLTTLLAMAATANAETVLLYEDFNDDYTKSFQYMYDADKMEPHHSIASIFYSNALESTMPWWIARDTSTSTDKYMASHSYYYVPATSNDWLISVPLEISTEGFVLEFDAQCVNVRGTDHISDLSLYITEELLNIDYIPETPTYVWENVPYGDDIDNCEGDWIHYTYNLDEYAGRTIYINFVNQNTDRDILCIDNVKVARQDAAILSLNDYEAYTLDNTTTVGATFETVDPNGIKEWTIALYADDEMIKEWSGKDMAYGAKQTVAAEISLLTGDARQFKFILTTDKGAPLSVEGNTTCMAFEPVHRVFFEETTSMKCGNCPMGAYNIESMLNDPRMADYVVPVSVHIASQGYDPMATESYYSKLPISNAAPLVFVERNSAYDGFIPAYDCEFDPENPKSFAYRINQRISQRSPVDIKIEGDWVINGVDTTAIKCTATVRPAYNIKDKEYRIAFILTENNVGIDNNPYWLQENYLSGQDFAGRCGGWCDLPKVARNLRYHDVARAISAYNGHANSLPMDMKYNEDYTFEYNLKIPTTALKSNGMLMSESIRTDFCEISAIVIDMSTGLAVNAARVPMSEIANARITVEDILKDGIVDVTTDGDDSEASAIYYDLTGRQVINPTGGVYIRQTPATVTKVIR